MCAMLILNTLLAAGQSSWCVNKALDPWEGTSFPMEIDLGFAERPFALDIVIICSIWYVFSTYMKLVK